MTWAVWFNITGKSVWATSVVAPAVPMSKRQSRDSASAPGRNQSAVEPTWAPSMVASQTLAAASTAVRCWA
ncbi:hypothetical protein D3C72_2167750 [compost metagenome]